MLTKYLRSDLDLLYFVSTIYPSWVKGMFPTGWVSRSCHKHFSVSRSHSWASGSCHKPFWHNMYHAGSEFDLSNLSCYYMQVIRSLHPSGSSDWAQLSDSTPDATSLSFQLQQPSTCETSPNQWDYTSVKLLWIAEYGPLSHTILPCKPWKREFG